MKMSTPGWLIGSPMPTGYVEYTYIYIYLPYLNSVGLNWGLIFLGRFSFGRKYEVQSLIFGFYESLKPTKYFKKCHSRLKYFKKSVISKKFILALVAIFSFLAYYVRAEASEWYSKLVTKTSIQFKPLQKPWTSNMIGQKQAKPFNKSRQTELWTLLNPGSSTKIKLWTHPNPPKIQNFEPMVRPQHQL